MHYVYAYYQGSDSAPFYIGKGCGDRAESHLAPALLNRRDRFHCKLRQLLADKVAIRIEVVHDNLSEAEAFELETRLIAEFGRKPNGPLYNLTDGGEGISGARHSDDFKKRQQIRMQGNKHSQGRIMPTRKPVVSKYFGQVIKYYACLTDVKQDGFVPSNVLKVINGELFQCGGYQWEYQ